MSRKIRLLLGGSPCTYWSISQKNNRETEPEGLGWELFKNYLIAKEKLKPDYFLYENNKSAAQPIKDQISRELGYPLQYINSALVSAQKRQRFYVHNIPNVPQPADRGILLKDIIESGAAWTEKGYALSEPVIFQEPHGFNKGGIKYDKVPTMTSNAAWEHNNKVVEPIRIGNSGSNSQGDRVYSPYGKSITLCGNGGGKGAKTGLYACPVNDIDGKARTIKSQYAKTSIANLQYTASYGATMVVESWDGKTYPVYEVKNGLITIKDKQYPIKLPDGYYIFRKLTVLECCRLQTFPDNYFVKADGTPIVSNSQAYKQLGNSWTVEVIKHILSYIPNLKDCDIEVLSMYDGISAGQLALERLGANVITYKAYEIDKYCLITTQYHFPNTIQCGDAFQVRNDEWRF